MKKMALLVISLMVVMSIVACSSKKETPSSTGQNSAQPSEKAEKIIGISMSTLNNPFFIFMKEKMEAKVKELGYTPIVMDSQDNPSKELSNVEDLINKKVSAILLNAVDSDASISSVKLANKAGIPVVGVDRMVNGGDLLSLLVSDNKGGGKLAGEYAVKALGGKGKIVIIDGYPGIQTTNDRHDGFEEVIKQNPELEIVATQAADYDRTKAFQVMENILQAHPKIDLVYALNDEMALGVVKALETANRTGVLVVGFDGAEAGIQAVQQGKMAATVAQQFGKMGQTGIEYLHKAITGDSVSVPKSSPVEVELVNKDNAEGYTLK